MQGKSGRGREKIGEKESYFLAVTHLAVLVFDFFKLEMLNRQFVNRTFCFIEKLWTYY